MNASCAWSLCLHAGVFSRSRLPTKSLRTSSALVGKAYMAAGQAGDYLHTIAVLQAYQADLLKDMDVEDDRKIEEKDRKGDSAPGWSPLGRWRIWGPSFSIKRLRPKDPDAIGPRPFGEEWFTPQHTVPALLSALRRSLRFPCHPRLFRAQWSPASFSLSLCPESQRFWEARYLQKSA